MQNRHKGKSIQESNNERVDHQIDRIRDVKLIPRETGAEGDARDVRSGRENASSEEDSCLGEWCEEAAVHLTSDERTDKVSELVCRVEPVGIIEGVEDVVGVE